MQLGYLCRLCCWLAASLVFWTSFVDGTNIVYNVFEEDTSLPPFLVYIGVMQSQTGAYSSIGAYTTVGSGVWSSMNSYFSNGMHPVVVSCDVQSSVAGTIDCFHSLTSQYNISVLIAPESSLVEAVAPLADAAGIPLIASVSGLQKLFVCDASLLPPCTKRFGPRWKTLIGNGATAATIPLGLMPLLRARGASTFAIVAGSDSLNTELCASFARDAINSRMTMVFNLTLPANEGVCNITTSASRLAAMQLRELDPDVVVWCNRPCCVTTAESMEAAKYRPRAFIPTQCTAEYPARFQYAYDVETWDPRALGNDYTDDASLAYCNNFAPDSGKSSAQLFNETIYNALQFQPTSLDASIYAGFYIAQAALVEANSTHPADVMRIMSLLNVPSFKGRLQIDSNRMVNWGGSFFTQISAASISEIIYPSSSATSSIIFPAPSYEELIYSHVPFENLCEQLVVALAVVVAVCTVRFAMYPIVILRATEAIRSINRWLSLVALCGVVTSNLSVLTWTVHNVKAQCDARLWLWVLGFSLMVTPLVGAFGHIQFIVGNRKFTLGSTILRNPAMQLLCQMVLFLTVLTVWTIQAPFQLVPIVRDVYRPSLNINECQTNGWLPYGLVMLGLFLLALIVLARAALSIRAGVRSHRFDRVREVLNASFLWIVLMGVLVMFQYASTTNVPATWMFTVRSLLLLANNCLYTILLFRVPISDAYDEVEELASSGATYPAKPAAVADRDGHSVVPRSRVTHLSVLPNNLKQRPAAAAFLQPEDVLHGKEKDAGETAPEVLFVVPSPEEAVIVNSQPQHVTMTITPLSSTAGDSVDDIAHYPSPVITQTPSSLRATAAQQQRLPNSLAIDE